MGWASASGIATPIIKVIRDENMHDNAKRRIYKAMLNALNDGDWDTQNECAGLCPVFDVLLRDEGYLHDDEDDE